jgi:hypothetical protein
MKKKSLLAFFLVTAFWGSWLALTSPARAASGKSRRHVFTLIENEYREGRISLGKRQYYRVAAVRNPGLLPNRFRKVVRDGAAAPGFYTPIMVEAAQKLPHVSKEWKTKIENLLAPPSELSYSVETTSPWPIRVTYDDPSLESKAQEVLDAAVISYEMEVQQWGFWEPPIETGQTHFMYYLQSTGMGGGGYTAPYQQVSSTSHVDYYVYVVIDSANETWTLPGIVAHEFNHACQAAMDGMEVIAFWENTATYIMSEVFESAWPYASAFFPIFQGQPHRVLEYMNQTQTDGYEYGGAVWVHFLQHMYGNQDPIWIRQVWEGTVQTSYTNEPDYFDVLTDKLQSEGGFQEMVRLFGQYRFFVGSDDDGQHIPDAGSWGGCEVARTAELEVSDLPVLDQSPAANTYPQPNGCNYITLDVESMPAGDVRFGFAGEAGVDWSVDVLQAAQGEVTVEHPMSLDAQSQGSVSLAPTLGDTLVMVVCNIAPVGHDPDDQSWNGAAYSYTVEEVAEAPTITSVSPSQVERGANGVILIVEGTNFPEMGTSIQLSGGGIVAGNVVYVSSQELKVQINVAQTADIGPRDLHLFTAAHDVTAGGALTITDTTQPDGGVHPDGGAPTDGAIDTDGGTTGGDKASGGCGCSSGGSTQPGLGAILLLLLAAAVMLFRARRAQG